MATNYEKYFGSPKRAGRTLATIDAKCRDVPDCQRCPLYTAPCCIGGDLLPIDAKKMRKWLKEEADE